MTRQSAKRTKVFHWIPPQYSARPKITVTGSDGTVTDITDVAFDWEFEDGHTDVIGRFQFSLWNESEQYTGLWTGDEAVRFYCDYSDTATSLRFKGYIEKPSYYGNKLKVTGRSNAQVLVDEIVSKTYNTIEASIILKDIIDTYTTGITYTNITASDTFLTINWTEKPFWDCVKELCRACGFSAYLDASDDFHFFEAGSVLNSGEAIVHDFNEREVGDFAEDLTFVKNHIIVYGAVVDGIQIIKSAKDITGRERKLIINDDNITDETQAQELADYELASRKTAPIVGDITATMLATIQPGENIYLSSPLNNIPPKSYQIISYKQKYSNRGWETVVKVNKEPRAFSNVLSVMITNDNNKNQTSVNPFQMTDTYNFFFNTDSGIHSNTQIIDGVLKPTAASGTWISDAKVLTSNILEAYLVLVGETLTGATVSVSGNNGLSYQTISNKSRIIMSGAIGTQLLVKVDFTSADTQIDSLSLQFKQ